MVDDGRRRRTDRQTPDPGHPISSPCEPNGSGGLKRKKKGKQNMHILKVSTNLKIHFHSV